MARKNRPEIEEISVDQLRSIAAIIGPQSAAAQALAEYEQRSKIEPDLVVLKSGSTLLVGPRHIH